MHNSLLIKKYNELTEFRKELSAKEVIQKDIPVVLFSHYILDAIRFFISEKIPHLYIVDYDIIKNNERFNYVIDYFKCKFFNFDDIANKHCVFAYINPDLYGSSQYGLHHMFEIIKNKGFKYFYHNKLTDHIFLEHQMLPESIVNASKFHEVYNLLSDDDSKDIFLRVIKTLITKKIGYLNVSLYPRFYHPIVNVMTDDFVIEGGLLDGKTTEDFALRTGENGFVLGFEAFPKFAEKCISYLSCYPWVKVENYGLWNSNSSLHIQECTNPHLTRLQEYATEYSVSVPTIKLDTFLFNEKNFINKFDILKLNIEGAEMKCLEGSINILKKKRPKLIISLFHDRYSIFDMPLYVNKNLPDYEFYIGHHTPNVEQTYLYAIPKEKKL